MTNSVFQIGEGFQEFWNHKLEFCYINYIFPIQSLTKREKSFIDTYVPWKED